MSWTPSGSSDGTYKGRVKVPAISNDMVGAVNLTIDGRRTAVRPPKVLSTTNMPSLMHRYQYCSSSYYNSDVLAPPMRTCAV